MSILTFYLHRQQQSQNKGNNGNAKSGQNNANQGNNNNGLQPLPGNFQAASNLKPLPGAANAQQGQQVLKPLPGFQNGTVAGQTLKPLGTAAPAAAAEAPSFALTGGTVNLSQLTAEANSVNGIPGAAPATAPPALATAPPAQLQTLPGAAAPSAAPAQLQPLPGASAAAPAQLQPLPGAANSAASAVPQVTASPTPQAFMTIPGMVVPPPAATPVSPLASLQPLPGVASVAQNPASLAPLPAQQMTTMTMSIETAGQTILVTMTALSGAQMQTAVPEAAAATATGLPAQVAGASRTEMAGGAALVAGLIGLVGAFFI